MHLTARQSCWWSSDESTNSWKAKILKRSTWSVQREMKIPLSAEGKTLFTLLDSFFHPSRIFMQVFIPLFYRLKLHKLIVSVKGEYFDGTKKKKEQDNHDDVDDIFCFCWWEPRELGWMRQRGKTFLLSSISEARFVNCYGGKIFLL